MKTKAAILSAILLATPAVSAPLLDGADSFSPLSRTASAILGPILASRERIAFSTGATLDLSLLEESVSADWSSGGAPIEAQVFALGNNPGPLLNGNEICGGDDPTYLAAWQNEFFGSWSLNLAIYQGQTQPVGIDTEGLCGTFTFDLDGPIQEDGAARDVSPGATEGSASADPGKWRIRESTDPVDDRPVFTMMLTADSGRSRMGTPVSFVARCKSNTTEAYAIWHDYVGDDSSSVYDAWKYVDVRIGDQPSERQRWTISTDKEATFAPDWAGTLLRRMASEDRLILRLTPYSENPVTAIFDTSGMAAHLEKLARTCNWTP